jgi:hypothetical protein
MIQGVLSGASRCIVHAGLERVLVCRTHRGVSDIIPNSSVVRRLFLNGGRVVSATAGPTANKNKHQEADEANPYNGEATGQYFHSEVNVRLGAFYSGRENRFTIARRVNVLWVKLESDHGFNQRRCPSQFEQTRVDRNIREH